MFKETTMTGKKVSLYFTYSEKGPELVEGVIVSEVKFGLVSVRMTNGPAKGGMTYRAPDKLTFI
jgi:hypothetical protein